MLAKAGMSSRSSGAGSVGIPAGDVVCAELIRRSELVRTIKTFDTTVGAKLTQSVLCTCPTVPDTGQHLLLQGVYRAVPSAVVPNAEPVPSIPAADARPSDLDAGRIPLRTQNARVNRAQQRLPHSNRCWQTRPPPLVIRRGAQPPQRPALVCLQEQRDSTKTAKLLGMLKVVPQNHRLGE